MSVLDSDQLLARAAERYPHVQTVWRSSVPSTNTMLANEARNGVVHDTVLFAGQQTAGRGRVGRTWWSESTGNLYVSARTTGNVPMANVGLISLGCAVMCARAIRRGVSIKWPNDILDATGRKVGGILCECVPSQTGADCYVMGVGINLRDAPQLETASALRMAADDATELCLALAMSLLEVPRWAADDPEGLVEAWRTHAHTLGRAVAIGATHTASRKTSTRPARYWSKRRQDRSASWPAMSP